jgi:predicted permease
VLSKGPDGSDTPYGPSQMELIRWQEARRSFEAIEAAEPRTMALTGRGEPELVQTAAVSSGLIPMLGVPPALGRVFSAGEERRGDACAVISERLRQRRFADVENPVGKTVVLDGRSYDIVGVMPAGFAPLSIVSDAWIPLNATIDVGRLNVRVMAGAGRLRADATPEQAERELASISAQIAREYPASHGRMRPNVVSLREQLYGTQKPGLLALAAAVAVLLLLAAANVVNLTLGQLATRRGELAVRTAVGATRWRLIRLQLVESLLLAGIGGAAALLVVRAVLPSLLALYAASGSARVEATVDWRVAAFAAAVVVGTAIASGVYPALRAYDDISSGVRTVDGHVGRGHLEGRLRAALLVAQVALAVVLLCAAATFTLSLRRVLNAAPGFSPDHVLSAQLVLSPLRYTTVQQRARFVEGALGRIATIAGVEAAGSTQTTFLPNQSMQTAMWFDGQPADADHVEAVHIRHITPGYFEALRVTVLEGRALDPRDRAGAPMVCLVSARFARQYWPGQSALGHQVRRTGPTAPWLTVVGVVADVMDSGLGVEQGPMLYVPYLQQNTPFARVTLLVRAAGDPLAIAGDVQHAVWAEDPLQPVDGIARLDDVLADSTGDRRFQTLVLAAFALVGLGLALAGIYGVATAAVQSRTWEVGVRLALGATPAGIVRGMFDEGARRVLAGVVAGIAIFLAVGRATAALLYGTSFADPAVLIAAVLPLAVSALVITLIQARRLARVQPVVALREGT